MEQWHKGQHRGFTLIELSIVLVVIGLIVGGVLAGRDLIKAAEVRAQIAQIEKYQTAINTFKGKYNNYLPGDIPEPDASNFGFLPRGAQQGEGDGNGLIEGTGNGSFSGQLYSSGETNMVWVDLSTAKMIDGSFNSATATVSIGSVLPVNMGRYMPEAKVKTGYYIYGYSNAGINYFGLSGISTLSVTGNLYTVRQLTPNQAYRIDQKMDDGQPGTGGVLAQYINAGTIGWEDGYPYAYATSASVMPLVNLAIPGSSTSCVDNGNVSRGVWNYSIGYNNGSGANCGLSFKFR